MNFGLIIIGDEILSGKRADQHVAKAIGILGQRAWQERSVIVFGAMEATLTP